MNVLVIPEDSAKDECVLCPIVSAMLAALGRPRARVRVCRSPRLRGISQALNWRRLESILARYRGMTDLFLLVVDRDGEESRRDSLNSLERNAAEVLPVGRGFLGENAWQEIEVWILAGHKLPPEWNWADIRADRDPKERYYVPFAEWTGHRTEPEGGRKTLALAAAKRYTTIRRRCPEDVANLEARVRDWMDSRQ